MEYIRILSLSAFSVSVVSATSLIVDDFSSGVITTNGRFRASQADTGWIAQANSLWTISDGVLNNAATAAGVPSEGGVGQIITTGSTASILEISFDYDVGTDSTLYFHSLGLTANTTGNVADIIANTGSQNGSIQNQSEDDYADLNLINGLDAESGVAGAIELTGAGTFTASIDVSTYLHAEDEAPGLTGAITNLSDFDLLFFAFAANSTSTNGNGAFSVDNFSVTAVPEPSSVMLLGIAGAALLLRRNR